MKNQLDALRIQPTLNGGHLVTHTFRPRLTLRPGAMAGGLSVDRPPAETHSFKPEEGDRLRSHIAEALDLRKS